MLFDSAPSHKVREITASRYFRKPVSNTFHGRDIFAPVAAYLAAGLPPAGFGRRIEDYVRLGFAKPARTGPQEWTGVILKIDRFGNLITNFESEEWGRQFEMPFEMRIGAQRISRLASNYAVMGAGEPFVIAGSSEFLEVSVNQESAADAVGAVPGGAVKLRFL